MGADLSAKRLQILKAAVPSVSRVALLVNPRSRSTEETGAVRTRQLETTNEKNWQPVLPKKMLCALDERPAN
jgi:hypothetical protein